MLFTSMEFLLIFFPITLAVYYFLPAVFRNYWLLAASLFFYAWGEPTFLIFMVISIVFNYLAAYRIDETPKASPLRRLFLAVAVIANLGLLFVYKYMNFTTATLHSLFPRTQQMFAVTEYVLPIGISFFTFQAMSYVIDVYRGGERGAAMQKNPAFVGLYIAFFPQLIAGPIVRYTTIQRQISHRTVTPDSFSEGVYRFVLGFNKKVLLANVLAEAADKAFAAASLSVGMAWLGIICYTLQIYFDFSGYSEMAIGLGRMFGFRFLENFDYPYISRTVTEFWRRWHISLGSWFRDYVYFPLGGSRVKSKARLVFNLLVVWLATGVWHGANWTFILWGLMYGVLITGEKLTGLPERLARHSAAAAVYQGFTLLAVMLGWVLFRAESLPLACRYLCAMFGLTGNALMDDMACFYFREYGVMIAVGVICATPLLKRLKERLAADPRRTGAVSGAACAVQLALFFVSVSCLVMNAHNPFIYFNF